MPRGGVRPNSGRKPKVEEQALIAKLSPLDDTVFDALQAGVERGDYGFIKLFMEYRWGKPQAKVDLTSGGDTIPMKITLNLG